MKYNSNNYLNTVLIFFIFSVFFYGCYQDDYNHSINEDNTPIVSNISLKELKKKSSLTKSLKLLNNKFDFYKKSKKISSNDGSFTLLTENILKTTKDSITSYTFLIKTPTDSTSSFENFVLIQYRDKIQYVLYKYKQNQNNELFPYDITSQIVNSNQIDKEQFNFSKIGYYMGTDGCLWYTEKWTNPQGEVVWRTPVLIFCPNDYTQEDEIITEDEENAWNGNSDGGGNSSSNEGNQPDNNNPILGSPNINFPTNPAISILTPKKNKDNCKELHRLTTSAYTAAAFVNMNDHLDQEQEMGYFLATTTSFPYFSSHQATNKPYDREIYVPNNTRIFCVIHTHPNKATPMFGFGDLLTLYKLYNRFPQNYSNFKASLFTIIMVIEDHTYAIKIEDIKSFKNFNLPLNELKKLGESLEGSYDELGDPDLGQQTNFEKVFLQFIKKNDLGIALYRTDDNTNYTPMMTPENQVSDWGKLELDVNNELKPIIKCN